MDWVKWLIIAGLVGSAVGGLEMWKNAAVEKNDAVNVSKRLAEDKATLEQDGKDKQGLINYADDLSKERYLQLKALEQRAVQAEAKLALLAKAKPAVAHWLTDCIDPDLRGVRRDRFPNSPSTDIVLCPGIGIAANTGTALVGSDKPRPVEGGPPVTRSVDKVQPREVGRTETTTTPKQVEGTVSDPAKTESILQRIQSLRGR